MNIKLGKDFRIVSVPGNLVLEKRIDKIDKDTEEIIGENWTNAGYHTTIKSLLIGYLRQNIVESEAQSLQELSDDVERIEKDINKFMLVSKNLVELLKEG